jgi:hypothetical protein
MVRKLFGVLAVALVLCLGAVLADEIAGRIMKVDGDAKSGKITVKTEAGDEKVITYNADTKWTKAGRGKKGEPPPPATAATFDDVKMAMEKAGERGVKATVKTEGKSSKATSIEIQGGRGKGGGVR